MNALSGFEILINGTPRIFRDRKDIASGAASQIQEPDRSTGLTSVMLVDGRLA